MSLLRFINDKNRGIESLKALCQYVTRSGELSSELVTGLGTVGREVMREMILCKRLYHQEKGKAYQHMIVSNNSSLKDVKIAHAIGVEVAQYYADKHQVGIYTHTDTNNLHSHIIINSVDMTTGKKLVQNKRIIKPLIAHANSVFLKYGRPQIGGCDIVWRAEDLEDEEFGAIEIPFEDDYYDDFEEEEEEYMVARMISQTMEEELGVKRPFYFVSVDAEIREIFGLAERMQARRREEEIGYR